VHKVLFAIQLLIFSSESRAANDDDDAADADGDDEEDNDHERVLLWVDDKPENNEPEVSKYGVMCDIEFVQLKSTRSVQEFLASHRALLRRTSAHFRLVTDRRRDGEPGDAGATLIAWLRSNGWRVPALIYCGDPVWGEKGSLSFLRSASGDDRVRRLVETPSDACRRVGVDDADAARDVFSYDGAAASVEHGNPLEIDAEIDCGGIDELDIECRRRGRSV
jgi:hypothetical protein